ncbi:cell polarity protein-like protein [Phyllosticta citriasiana]|uniref:Cell polarity protein-like protein n=1 Tax=Phyllosticta citriasiana TaxID=595635 RepID=A0ABR1KNJ3_9PEZI
MSFLFKSKKQQPSALPAASRSITSSDGPPSSSSPAANGNKPPRDDGSPKTGSSSQTPTPGTSVNNSLSSLGGATDTQSPEPKSTPRERSDSELQNGRPVQAHPPRSASESPYPWSQRRLNFTTGANPFPRYGAAVNSSASKDGTIYVMGGLVNGTTVKGDLWTVEAGGGNMACLPISTTSEGPGPRVGHASLLVGNAFIVFGGDTKLDEGDILDDTLYLLNTSTKQWSRALPAGPRPSGRYGHTLNILGSKLFVFGGQVEGTFFNDLACFDLNALQSPSNRWEVLINNTTEGGPPAGSAPPARTNHSMVQWNDKLYLFGGTDGINWFSDVWCYDPKINSWSELDCIGYIPLAREGHAAAIVNDTMYIFGGRTREGTDLGDLAAFRITSRRWYMFQNMGPSPSPRSGHSMTAYGQRVIVLAGEPSSSAPDRNELSIAYVLDTSKIRYPSSENQPAAAERGPMRKLSGGGERSGIPQARGGGRESMMGGPPRPNEGPGAANGPVNSRLPRASGPPPQQQPPQPRPNGNGPPTRPGSKTPTKAERGYGPLADAQKPTVVDRDTMSPVRRDSPSIDSNVAAARGLREQSPNIRSPPGQQVRSMAHQHKISSDSMRNPPSRSESRSNKHKPSVDSIAQNSPRTSAAGDNNSQPATRDQDQASQIDSGVGSSPAVKQQNDETAKELEAARNRNAWLASELALARKAGYQTNASPSQFLDERAADAFGDDDRPLVEALIKMRAELAKIQGSIDAQAVEAANKIAQIEKQRDAAISEAVYAKTKLAAHGGSQAGTPQPDSARGNMTPDIDRMNELNRRLASSLNAQSELSSRVDSLLVEIESEKRARKLAEDTAEAANKRAGELDSFRQRSVMEVESLKAALHEAEKMAREESANAAEASANARMLTVDKNELAEKLAKSSEDISNHANILQVLREAVSASSERATHLEEKLEEERAQRSELEQQLACLRSEHDERSRDLESSNRRLKDAEEMAAKHAAEAATHRQAVLSGLTQIAERNGEGNSATDERIQILQEQAETANAMVRKNQEAADTASEKLRRAEERIAGLETFQEQASREGLSVRKQLQNAVREMQQLQAEKAELQQQFERQLLETNAHEVQLKTLKNLLDERGIGTTAESHRRSRALDSPISRFSTPELNRVRELEQQLEASLKAHDEIRSNFESREAEISKEWEEKITALHNDHQAAVKYLRGTEKMLAKMKQELDKYKAQNAELEENLKQQQRNGTGEGESSEPIRQEMEKLQNKLKEDVSNLESQILSLQSDLASARREQETAAQTAQQLEVTMAQKNVEVDTLRHERAMLEERAREAEQRVQMFLDQFETSVDSYRRQSSMVMPPGDNGTNHHGHRHNNSTGESVYSQTTDITQRTPTPDAQAANTVNMAAQRSSMALDSLATELESLRSNWESTNRAYRLSERFDFDRTPTSAAGDLSESLLQWQSRINFDDDDDDNNHYGQALGSPTLAQQSKSPTHARQGSGNSIKAQTVTAPSTTMNVNGEQVGSPKGPGPGGAAMI